MISFDDDIFSLFSMTFFVPSDRKHFQFYQCSVKITWKAKYENWNHEKTSWTYNSDWIWTKLITQFVSHLSFIIWLVHLFEDWKITSFFLKFSVRKKLLSRLKINVHLLFSAIWPLPHDLRQHVLSQTSHSWEFCTRSNLSI